MRIAWGSTVRRMVCHQLIPRAFDLPLWDGLDASAHNLSHVGGFVEAEANHREEERVFQGFFQADLCESEIDAAVNVAEQTPEHQLHVDGGPSENPQIHPAHPA